MEFQPGPTCTLDEAVIEKIVSNISKVFIMKHIAQLSDIPYKTLYHWMVRGKKEAEVEDAKMSIYVKLYLAYNKKRSEALAEKLSELATCPKNYGALVWILEKCYKNEFMTLPEDVKKALEFLEKLKPMMEKGVPDYGSETKEVDSESN